MGQTKSQSALCVAPGKASISRRVGSRERNLESRLDPFLRLAIHPAPTQLAAWKTIRGCDSRATSRCLSDTPSCRSDKTFVRFIFAFDPASHSTGWCHDWEAVSFRFRDGSVDVVGLRQPGFRSMGSVRGPVSSVFLRPRVPASHLGTGERMRQRCLWNPTHGGLRWFLCMCSADGCSARH